MACDLRLPTIIYGPAIDRDRLVREGLRMIVGISFSRFWNGPQLFEQLDVRDWLYVEVPITVLAM